MDNYLEFKIIDNAVLMPSQIETKEYVESIKKNTIVYVTFHKPRDLGFHKCYFALLRFIYLNLPLNFRTRFINKFPNSESKQLEFFRTFLKDVLGEYEEVVFNKRTVKIYNSISFKKMNQLDFNKYVNKQLGDIYTLILVPLDCGNLMDEINIEFQKFLDKLN
jgi:hypothetical protein